MQAVIPKSIFSTRRVDARNRRAVHTTSLLGQTLFRNEGGRQNSVTVHTLSGLKVHKTPTSGSTWKVGQRVRGSRVTGAPPWTRATSAEEVRQR